MNVSLPCFLNAVRRCESSLTAQLHTAGGSFQAEKLIQADMERISKVLYPYEPKYSEEDQKHFEGGGRGGGAQLAQAGVNRCC